MSLKLLIFGPPGSGKGTLSELLAEDYGFVHLSAGSLLRDEVDRKTPIGVECAGIMASGNLIPNRVVVDLVMLRLEDPKMQQNGVLLDGFPRTLRQATELTQRNFALDAMIHLQVDDSVLADRCLQRRIDPVTGRIYNIKTDKPPENIVERLQIRSDDTREKHAHRMLIYRKQRSDLVTYYRDIIIQVDANAGVRNVYQHLKKDIDQIIAAHARKTQKPESKL